ncbi:hypothetical protein AAG565_09585 [Fontimonas sp. SYSU GA230001]|uniref:hypothetical protein n=1 Tax=Fontimonas sp. SYSU GA230001 TaxID=3142450 RepID=UPI0032B4792F
MAAPRPHQEGVMLKPGRGAALAAALCCGIVLAMSEAEAADAKPAGTVPVKTAAAKSKKPAAQNPDDRVWFSLGAKGGGGMDAGAGAFVALNYLEGDGTFFRLQHHTLLVDERGPEQPDDDDCWFFACFFDAFFDLFSPDVASVTETGVLIGRRLDSDSRWFAAIGIARQSYSDNRKTDSRDDIGVGVPAMLGWSTAVRRSGVGFEFALTGSAGQVSNHIGAQIGITFGGRSQ